MRLISTLKRPVHLSLPCLSSFGVVGAANAPLRHGMCMNMASTSLQLTEFVNAWSVNGATLSSSDIASNLFAVSVVPYLVMLFFLSRPATKTPPLGNFGFQFLLVFVAATIPAGIWAKVHYHEVLANVDWLHGGAEFFLTLTNLFIIKGFADASAEANANANVNANTITRNAGPALGPFQDSALIAAAVLLGAGLAAASGVEMHAEPANALSLPTWVVHVSSLLEWATAMQLVRQYAAVTQNPRWRAMAWAMLPSQAAGQCAVTWHLFFNAPALSALLALQAALTLLSNVLMAVAAFRVSRYERDRAESSASLQGSFTVVGEAAYTSDTDKDIWAEKPVVDAPVALAADPSAFFFANLALKSVLLAAAVKWGELRLPLFFADPASPVVQLAALALVLLFPSLIAAQWATEKEKSEDPRLAL